MNVLRRLLGGGAPDGEPVVGWTDLAANWREHLLHAAWVEQAFVGRLLRDAGRRFDGPVVDTAALAREALVVRERAEGEPDLEALAGTLGLPVHTPHHALGDALTTATVLLALVARLEARGEVTVRALGDVTRRRGVQRVMG